MCQLVRELASKSSLPKWKSRQQRQQSRPAGGAELLKQATRGCAVYQVYPGVRRPMCTSFPGIVRSCPALVSPPTCSGTLWAGGYHLQAANSSHALVVKSDYVVWCHSG